METISKQPGFPIDDLTDKNAVALKKVLQNPNLSHIAAPENKHGHLDELLTQFDFGAQASDMEVAHGIYLATEESLTPVHAVNLKARLGIAYGYTLYETISSLVIPHDYLSTRTAPALVAVHGLDAALQRRTLPEYLDESRQKLREDQPNAVALVETFADPLGEAASEYALLGAAVRRCIELDSHDYLQSLAN